MYKGQLFFLDPGGESPAYLRYYPVNKDHWLPPAPNILRKDIQADHRTCALFNDLICRLFVSGLSAKYIGSVFNKNSVTVNHAIIRQYKDKYHIAFDFNRVARRQKEI